MDKQVKQDWLEALEGGEYKQVRGGLCKVLPDNGAGEYEDEYGYCCLGVLADIAGDKQWRQTDDACNPLLLRYSYDNSTGSLRDNFLTEVGLSPEDQSVLMNMNDTKKWSFQRIATWIRRRL